MKKVALSIEYNGKSVISDYAERSEKEIKALQELCESAAKGSLAFLRITCENKEYYFPEKIIEQSILSLVYKD